MRWGLPVVLAVAAACATLPVARPVARSTGELSRALASILAPPPITTAPGFSATIVVPVGGMHDTMSVLPRDGGVFWINDDGGAARPGLDRGGFVWRFDSRTGRVSRLVDATKMLPSTGMGLAPEGFGRFAGRLITIATPTVLRVGVSQPHVIQAVDPKGVADAETICTLPIHGRSRNGVPGGGSEARFGPPWSGFANRFFSITIFNDTIYQTTGDGRCQPFVTFPDGSPWTMAFTADGSRMLVVVRAGGPGGAGGPNARSQIRAVAPDGTVDATPVYVHTDANMFDIAVAPPDLGAYAGQIFFTHRGPNESSGNSVAPAPDGSLVRIAPDGTPHIVAAGMFNPGGFAFADGAIWIGDRSRDGPYMGGRWLPDAYVVRIDVGPARGRTPAPGWPEELQITLGRMLAPPPLKEGEGFAAQIVVPPGELYDPLSIVPRGDQIWVNDAGGEDVARGRGGRLLSVGPTGAVTALVGMDRLLPPMGFALAPPGFGAFVGKVLTLAQPKIDAAATRQGHVIEQLDVDGTDASVPVCTLPNSGSVEGGVAGGGAEARFGPPGTPFASRLFVVASLNHTIYEMNATGACRPFTGLDGVPTGLAFSADGTRMLVAVRSAVVAGPAPAAPQASRSAIVAVDAQGRIDSTPVFSGGERMVDVEVAPPDFAPYGGQVFFSDWQRDRLPGLDGTPNTGGAVYRIGPDGRVHVVVSGFYRPTGLAFIKGELWVTDVNGPFMSGMKVPDGLVVRIRRR